MSNDKITASVAPTALEIELNKLKTTIEGLDKEEQVLLTKWIKEWENYIRFNKVFQPGRNIAYKAGYIAQVNFGQNLGSEQSGVRPAVVMEDNNRSSPVVTVIPLSSLKDEVTASDVESKGNVYLGVLAEYNTAFNQDEGTESIALLGQIRSVSKMRIQFPRNRHDTIIQLNEDLLEKIYSAMRPRYTESGITKPAEGTKLAAKDKK